MSVTKKGVYGKKGGDMLAPVGRRPKNQQVIENMTAVYDPESIGKIVFTELGKGFSVVEDVGLAEKFARISEQLSLRLEKGSNSGESTQDAEASKTGSVLGDRPWSGDELPINVIIAAERHAYANDRIMSALVSHLLEHAAIGEELRSVAASARRRAADELANIPLAMVEFVNVLMAAGVVTRDVRYLSRKRLGAIVAAIKEVDPSSIADDLPQVAIRTPKGDISSEGAGVVSTVDDGFSINGIIEEKAGASATVDNSTVSGESTLSSVEDGSEAGTIPELISSAEIDAPASEPVLDRPVMPLQGVSEAVGTEGSILVDMPMAVPSIDAPGGIPVIAPPVPPGRWDVLDLTGLGYRIEEKMAESDDEMRAIRYALPEVSTLSELAAQGSAEVNIALGVENQMDRDLAATFFTRWCRRTSEQMTEEQKRIWIFLLVEMPLRDRGRRIGEDGWFDGLLMPGPKGTARVRRIVAIDRSEDALRMALPRSAAG